MVLVTILQCALCIGAAEPIEPPNAADAWNELFAELEHIPYIDHEAGYQMPYYENDIWDERAHAHRLQMAPFVDRAREIANMEHCDWNLDYSQGFDLLVPHLGHLREVQRMLQYSLRGEMALGNTSGAITELDAMLGITRHNLESELLIGALVASSNFKMATQDASIIDSAEDAEQLESMLMRVEQFDSFDPFGVRENVGKEKEMTLAWLKSTEDPDFAIFESITGQEIDTSTIDMEAEIERYAYGMGKIETIFQMTDKDVAIAAAEALDAELEGGGLGFLATMLSPSSNKLLHAAFRGEEMVADFKQLLRDKIDMIRNPNAATYFLRAAESYNSLDAEERMKAMEQGDYSVIDEPLNLFTKACSMPVKQITLSDEIEVPYWIAPLHSLALDALARCTEEDNLAVAQFVGHLSQQQRFEASIVAGTLFQLLGEKIPWHAFATLPVADAFMLQGNAMRAKKRLASYYYLESEDPWDPSKANILAMTLTMSKQDGVHACNPQAWGLFVETLLVPDDDFAIEIIIEDWNIEALPIVELEAEELIHALLNTLRKQLAEVRSSMRPRGR